MGIAVGIHPGLDEDAPPLTIASSGRYVLGEEIGRGGGGRVLLATDRDLRRSVALKVLAERHVHTPARVQAFLEEAIITAGLEHPNIVPVYDLGWGPDVGFYYTMKRLTGRPLVDILDDLRSEPPQLPPSFSFPLSRSLSVFVELCRAVAYSHRRGVLHSDLKPDNIMVGEFGEVVVVDWGMAQLLGPAGESQIRAGIRGGTPTYMAPEQFTETGASLGVEVDSWALGVVLYELLTLTVPFQGADADEIGMRVMIEPLTPPSQRAPDREIPPGIEEICMRALERDAERRYPCVAQLLADVEAWLAGTRERMRREEQLAHAIDTARALLGPLAPAEAKLQAALDSEGAELDALREELLTDYELAAETLCRGLRIDGEHSVLQTLAGELYWRIFTGVYPSRRSPRRALRERSIILLTRLFKRACTGVVRVGRALAQADKLPDAETSTDLPSEESGASLWLSVAQMVAGREDNDLRQTSAMHSVLARLSSLKEIPLFRQMPAANLLPIADACRELVFAPGEMIFGQGDPGDTLYVLVDGYVDILRDGAVINTLGPGECFGEIAVLGETDRTASASAVDSIRTLVLDAPRFRRIVRESGEIGLAVIQAMGERLRVATRREGALRALASTILSQAELSS